jgi:MFS family permease
MEPEHDWAPPPPPPPPPPLPLWRNRDYMLLWGGQGLSFVGFQIQGITLPLLILALTRSPAQAGIAAALDALPFPLLSLPAGAFVDRWDRKRVMVVCDAGRAIAAGSIPLALWTGHLTMAQIYLVAVVEGILSTFFTLAETASLPNVVGKDQLPSAMGQNYATASATGILGPPLGGFLYTISHALPFLANAVSFAASVLSLRLIRAGFQQERRAAPRHLRADIREGLTWAWRHPLVRFLALRNGAGNIVYAGSGLIVIVLAKQRHAPPVAIGAIFAIESIGGIAGSLIVGRLQRRLSFAQITLGFVWITALLFPLYAIAPSPLALGLIAVGLSFALVIFDVTQLSYRAAIIPDEIFGRVTSSIRLLSVGGLALGPALAGALLQTLGPLSTVLVFAAWLLILALATTANPHVRSAW